MSYVDTPGVDPIELGRLLGIDITNLAPPPPQGPPADPLEREVVDSLPPPVADALLHPVLKADGTVDGSATSHHIIAVCIEAGLTLAQIRWVVDLREDLRDRTASFLARTPPVDDVLNDWEKLYQRNGWAIPQPGAAAQPGPAAPPAPPLSPARFFGRNGLYAQYLANEVMAAVTCGYGHADERFYTYGDGVWAPGDKPIRAEITRQLANRYRTSHTKTVLDLIEYAPDTVTITDEPLTDFINVPNGMVMWDTGQVLPHDPAYRSTVQLPVEYVPGSRCPVFEKFLADVLPPDLFLPTKDGPGFIWELIGYALYSGNPLHVAVLLFGKGRNGKGTLIRVLKALLGEQNVSSVSLHELTENRFRAATLFQKLANLAGDLDSKWLENTALFKKITGHDTIQGEHKYGAAFDFDPWALPFYSANKAFGSPDSSEGWVARWVVVPFPHSFLGREDRTLDARLTSESELRGILAKGIDALPYLMARGNFPELGSLAEAKNEFVIASDAVRSWLDEYCLMEDDAWTPRTELYKSYRWSSLSDGGKTLGAREFYNRVEQVQGVITSKRMGTRGFKGIRPKPGWNTGTP